MELILVDALVSKIDTTSIIKKKGCDDLLFK